MPTRCASGCGSSSSSRSTDVAARPRRCGPAAPCVGCCARRSEWSPATNCVTSKPPCSLRPRVGLKPLRPAPGTSSHPRPPPGFNAEPPPVQYVKGPDGISLAYQVAGDVQTDLVIIPGYVSELDNWWEAWAGRLVRRFASFSRIILFDKRGVGLADRPEHITMRDSVEDTRTVLDAVGSERPAVLGMSGGGAVAMQFAATYPERTGPLIVYAATPRSLADDTDYPATVTREQAEGFIARVESVWGTGGSLRFWCPSVGDEPTIRAQFGQYERRSASPGSRPGTCEWCRCRRKAALTNLLPDSRHPPGERQDHPGRHRSVHRRPHPRLRLCLFDTEDHLIWFSEAIDQITDAVSTSSRQSPIRTRRQLGPATARSGWSTRRTDRRSALAQRRPSQGEVLGADAGEVDGRLRRLALAAQVDDHALPERRVLDVIADHAARCRGHRSAPVRCAGPRHAASTTRSRCSSLRRCSRCSRSSAPARRRRYGSERPSLTPSRGSRRTSRHCGR